MHLSDRSDQDLLSDIAKLVGSQREVIAQLIAHLAEIEERRLQLKMGFSSMFELCVKHFKMSEGEAFRRILAARLGRRFPIIHSLIASGAIHLTTLELLRERLTDANHAELLEAVCGKNKREIEQLIATRFPRADVPSRIRKLPDQPIAVAEPNPSLLLEAETSQPKPPKRARIEPLSESRFKVEFTARFYLGAFRRESLQRIRFIVSTRSARRPFRTEASRRRPRRFFSVAYGFSCRSGSVLPRLTCLGRLGLRPASAPRKARAGTELDEPCQSKS